MHMQQKYMLHSHPNVAWSLIVELKSQDIYPKFFFTEGLWKKIPGGPAEGTFQCVDICLTHISSSLSLKEKYKSLPWQTTSVLCISFDSGHPGLLTTSYLLSLPVTHHYHDALVYRTVTKQLQPWSQLPQTEQVLFTMFSAKTFACFFLNAIWNHYYHYVHFKIVKLSFLFMQLSQSR